jgi:hypothetical protein
MEISGKGKVLDAGYLAEKGWRGPHTPDGFKVDRGRRNLSARPGGVLISISREGDCSVESRRVRRRPTVPLAGTAKPYFGQHRILRVLQN